MKRNLVAEFALVWISNHYMGVYDRLRLTIKSEHVENRNPGGNASPNEDVTVLFQVAALSPEVFRVEVETESHQGERDWGALDDGAHL